jgi:hypothetical protein
MPRHDWNRPQAHTQAPHHRRMKSGAKGKGHDHYIRAAKQEVSQAKANAWKADVRRRENEREEKEGTVKSGKHNRLDPDEETMRTRFQAFSIYGYGPGDNVRKNDGTVGDTTLQRYQKRLDPGMPGGSVRAQLDRVRIKTP